MTSKKRILYIEDEWPDLKPRIEMIQEKGYEVVPTGDVEEACRLLKTKNFDLIMLDIMLPMGLFEEVKVKKGYETGLAFMRKIRKELKINVPVIVTTAYPPMDIEKTFKDEFGIEYYLRKPISQVMLEKCIDEILAKENIHVSERSASP